MAKQEAPQSFKLSPVVLVFLLTLGFFYLLDHFSKSQPGAETIPYSQFLSDVDEGKVAEVALSTNKLTGELKQAPPNHSKYFSSIRVEDPNLAQRLKTAGIQFSGLEETSGFWSAILSAVLPLIILFVFWSMIFRRSFSAEKGGGFLSLGKSKAKVYVETDLKTKFEDVAGVDEAKEELQEIVNFLKEPERYSSLGGRMPKGILLVGPPGTGKTLLARAVAGEARVPFFSINGSEFVEMFVGLGAARVRDLFEQARKQAPCIIFIDELDALGKARGISAITGGANDEKEQTLNQLLAELDGFDPSQGVVLLAATNRPEILDPALLRAGRFDRSILVDKPDRQGRAQILKVHSKKIKLDPSVDIEAVASMTAGFSGADLANLVNEAALIATRRKAPAVNVNDFTQAIERIVAGLERKSRLLNPEEKKRVAYHEMGHAAVALALGHDEIIHKVSIIPRGISALGYTLSRPTEDRYLMERNELETKMAIALGGRASEMKFFTDISTGAGDDLDKATDIARAMVTRYGMNDELGVGVFERDPSPMLGSQMPVRTFEYSEQTAQQIDLAVKSLLHKSLDMAGNVIERYRAMVDEGAQILLTQETLDEPALKRLWEKYRAAPATPVSTAIRPISSA
ncbi:MAG: ATP-dependent zinc metalloprotease FtsH [Oligoflexia bacterium]|nr:ATP-dependent zinc metalloprotease FtsH [Oligoflexia bacterium]